VKFPPVSVDQLLGLLKAVYSLGGKADAMHVSNAISTGLGGLPLAIDAAEMLGLIRARGGDLELTEAGRAAVSGPLRELQKYLRAKLRDIEPFASLLRLVGELKRVEITRVAELLRSKGYSEEGAQRVLEWAVFAQLVEISEGAWVVLA
jgi:hypothetical protein